MIPLQTIIIQFAETSLLIGIILSLFLPLRPLLRRAVGSQWLSIIWLLVLGRLLFPFSIESRWSVLDAGHFPHPGHALAQQPAAMIMNAPEKEPPAFEKGVTAGVTNPDHVSSQTNPIEKSAPGILDWLCGIWAAGVLASFLGLALQMRRTRALAAQTYRVTGPRLLEVFKSIDTKLRGNVELRMTEALAVPTLAGMRHPQIWVPAAWPEQLAAGEMRHVLLHELGHAHRRDLVVQWLFSVAQCLHWFNPLVWLAARLARFDRELACDAWVMTQADDNAAPGYGLTLMKIVRLLCAPASASPGLIEMATSKQALATRVRAIGAFRRISTLHGILGVIATLAGLTIMTAVGGAPIDAASPSPAAASTSPSKPTAEPSKNDSGFHIEIETTFVEVTKSVAQRLQAKRDSHNKMLLPFIPGPMHLRTWSLAANGLKEQNKDTILQGLANEEGVKVGKMNKSMVVPGGQCSVDSPANIPNLEHVIVKPKLDDGHEMMDLNIKRASSPESAREGLITDGSVWSGQSLILECTEMLHGDDQGKAPEPCSIFLFITGRVIDSQGKPVLIKPKPPQISLVARFILLTDEAVEKLKLDSVIHPDPVFSNDTTAGIREDAQIQTLLKSLDHQKGVDLMTAPGVTTRSGQRAVIEMIHEFRAPSTWKKDPKNPGGWLPNEYETTNVGATFYVEPELQTDGTISVVLVPKLIGFLGMVDIETGKPSPSDRQVTHPMVFINWNTNIDWPDYHYVPGHRNMPVFSKLGGEQLVVLKSGQSVLMVLKETADTRPFQESVSKNHVLVIVTAQTVDPVTLEPVPPI